MNAIFSHPKKKIILKKFKNETALNSPNINLYFSEEHLKCLLKNKGCNELNLVSSDKLSNKYNYISPSYGDNFTLQKIMEQKL